VAAASASSFAPDSVATGDLVRYIYNFHKSLSLPVNSRGGGWRWSEFSEDCGFIYTRLQWRNIVEEQKNREDSSTSCLFVPFEI